MNNVKYIKIILERNNNINWNNCVIDKVKCKYSENDIKNEMLLSNLFRELPCIENDQTLTMLVNIDDNIVENWELGRCLDIDYMVNSTGIYQFLDENGCLIVEQEYFPVPKQLQYYEKSSKNRLILSIDSEGKIIL